MLLATFFSGLFAITLVELVSHLLEMPSILEWGWIFIIAIVFIVTSGFFSLIQGKRLKVKLVFLGVIFLALVLIVILYRSIVLN